MKVSVWIPTSDVKVGHNGELQYWGNRDRQISGAYWLDSLDCPFTLLILSPTPHVHRRYVLLLYIDKYVNNMVSAFSVTCMHAFLGLTTQYWLINLGA